MKRPDKNFSKECISAIGVDLGGTKINIAFVNKEGKIEEHIKIPTYAEQGKDLVISRIKKGILQLIFQRDKKIENIAGIGMGVPGPVNYKSGVIHFAPNLPGWKEVPLAEIIKQEFQMPIIIENDANVAAWGEKIFGAAQGINDMICLTLGTGIGGGLIFNGEIYHGRDNVAGEIGHIIVKKDGIPCNCGNYGCLEAYSSASGIKQRIYRRITEQSANDIDCSSLGNLDNLSLVKVFELARQGNVIVKDIVEEAIEYLGIGIASLVNILNPEMIVLVGGITNEGEKLLKPIREIVFRRAMISHTKNLKIVFGQLGEYAGVIGAAALVWNFY